MTKNNDKQEKYYTVTELSTLANLSRQAISMAIKKKRLKADKFGMQWRIAQKDWMAYLKNKYSRDYNFKNWEGEFSLRQAAILLRLSYSKSYYESSKKRLNTQLKGKQITLNIEDIKSYAKTYGIKIDWDAYEKR